MGARGSLALAFCCLLLALVTSGCDEASSLLASGTPAPTEVLRREVVRLDATRLPAASPTALVVTAPSPTPASSIQRQALIVGTEGNGLNGRAGPSVSQAITFSFAEGSVVQLVEGPVEADGYTWWRAQGGGGDAWVASKWLQLETPASPTAAGSQTPDWKEIR
jgi:hypothetical protein